MARKERDEALLSMLDPPEEMMEALYVVRSKSCCEPSVHGGKPTRADDG